MKSSIPKNACKELIGIETKKIFQFVILFISFLKREPVVRIKPIFFFS